MPMSARAAGARGSRGRARACPQSPAAEPFRRRRAGEADESAEHGERRHDADADRDSAVPTTGPAPAGQGSRCCRPRRLSYDRMNTTRQRRSKSLPGHGHRAAIGGGDPGLPPQPGVGGDVVPCHHRPRRGQPRGDHVPLRFEGTAGRRRPRCRARGVDTPGARSCSTEPGDPATRSARRRERARRDLRRAARSAACAARGLRPRRARSRP